MTGRRTPLEGAERKGAVAYLAGEPITACPYADHRKPNGGLSWSRAFGNAWRRGWRKAEQLGVQVLDKSDK